MTDLISTEALVTFLQVVMIDLVLAGDNAIVIGLAAAGLPQQQRTRVILVGILAATALRVLFAGITTQLLQVIGLLLAGGILLLWVCWKMWRELRTSPAEPQEGAEALVSYDINADGTIAAGAAREHPMVLAFGLLLSIALMGVAANVVARLLQKHRWIAYVGLAIILYVACEMIYRGAYELKPMVKAAVALL